MNLDRQPWHRHFPRVASRPRAAHVRRPWRLALALALAFGVPPARSEQPAVFILCVGDGMGIGQVRAATCFLGTNLSFQALPVRTEMTCDSATGPVTDSAAAATAMATGRKVYNGVLSLALPGDGSPMPTLLERFKDQRRRTGLVSTTYITDATPAAFAAHQPDRRPLDAVARDYLERTRPNVLLGGGGAGMTAQAAQSAGYAVVTNRDGLLAVDPRGVTYLSGQFGATAMPYEADGLADLPHLSEMVDVALDVLDSDPEGFFLLVEGGRIDHACHANDLRRAVLETVEFAAAVERVMAWAQGRDDALVVVTADHETGGLEVLGDNGPGLLPSVAWTTWGHTEARVPLYAWGRNASLFSNAVDNTRIPGIAAWRGAGLFAELRTAAGTIGVRLYETEAPRTVANFVSLAEGTRAWIDFAGGRVRKEPFYSGTLMQPFSDGYGSFIRVGRRRPEDGRGPGFLLDPDVGGALRHERAGLLSTMPPPVRESGAAQFLISLTPTPWLDGVSCVFGRTVDGMNVLRALGAALTGIDGGAAASAALTGIRIVRNGPGAEAYDPSAVTPPLPRVRALTARIAGDPAPRELRWLRRPGCRYWVLATVDLANPDRWGKLTPDPVDAAALDLAGFPPVVPSAFFRVVEVEEPARW